ncbi:MAG: SDR family oxidoreductase [Desulfocapsaceae bacterium]
MSSGDSDAWNGSVAINGATGYIGTHVVDELIGQGEQPVCLVRKRSSRDARFLASLGAKIIKVNAQASDGSLIEALAGCDRLVHLIGSIAPPKGMRLEDLQTGTAKRYLDAARQAGVQKVVMVTALGCGPNASSEYHRTKWLAEEVLRSSGLDWVIIRPSLVVGRTVGQRDSKLVRRYLDLIANKPRIPLVLGGKNLVQPIAVADLAQALAIVVKSDRWDLRTLQIAGKDSLTTREFVAELMHVQGVDKNFLTIPAPLAWIAAVICETFQSVPLLSRDQLRIARVDGCVDENDLDTQLEITPVSLQKALAVYGEDLS